MIDELITTFGTLLAQMLTVVTGNKDIWIPIMGAWVAGFLYSQSLKTTKVNGECRPIQKSQKELNVYGMNGMTALILYLLFNFQDGFEAIQQATLAASCAVLLPLVWFKILKK